MLQALGVEGADAVQAMKEVELSEKARLGFYQKAVRMIPEVAPSDRRQLVDLLAEGLRYSDVSVKIMSGFVSPYLNAEDFSPYARALVLKEASSADFPPNLAFKVAGIMAASRAEVDAIKNIPDTLLNIFTDKEDIAWAYYKRSYEWGFLLYKARMGDEDAAAAILAAIDGIDVRWSVYGSVLKDLAYTKNSLLMDYLKHVILTDKAATYLNYDMIIRSPSVLAARAMTYWDRSLPLKYSEAYADGDINILREYFTNPPIIPKVVEPPLPLVRPAEATAHANKPMVDVDTDMPPAKSIYAIWAMAILFLAGAVRLRRRVWKLLSLFMAILTVFLIFSVY
jgi:hypothetical protein